MRKWNFCAGPAVISEEVLSEVQSEILEYNNLGTSILEMSHRSEAFTKVAFEAKEDAAAAGGMDMAGGMPPPPAGDLGGAPPDFGPAPAPEGAAAPPDAAPGGDTALPPV